jgi:DNA invertase Pin-like site-specific DNA recombinase
MANGNYVSYLRVSTARQGASGLGLEAQRNAVDDFLNGGKWKLIAEFVEVESGKNHQRVELENALRACRLHSATLVVAKLDRLARNAEFLLRLQRKLQETGARFVACDLPEANEMIVGILAVVAQAESRMISQRTKAALQAAKARGTKLGTPRNLTSKGMRKGVKASATVRTYKAKARAQDMAPILAQIQSEGATSLREIAARLSARGIRTPRDKSKWSAIQVRRVIARLNSAA